MRGRILDSYEKPASELIVSDRPRKGRSVSWVFDGGESGGEGGWGELGLEVRWRSGPPVGSGVYGAMPRLCDCPGS